MFPRLLLGCCFALFLHVASLFAAEEMLPMATLVSGETIPVKHAIVCPPFKGNAALGTRYHDALVNILKESDALELLEGRQAQPSKTPEFTYWLHGEIIQETEGQSFVSLTVMDAARRQQVGSYIAPATLDEAALQAWCARLRESILQHTSKLPFECGIRRGRTGQTSITLDRGLSSGLQPGVILELSADEIPLLSPVTGEEIGRDAGKAIGKLEVFRVMEYTSYARLLSGNMPKHGRVFARTF